MASYHVLLYTIVQSINSGLYTQASHAFIAKNSNTVGILLYRAIIINLLFFVIMQPVIYYLDYILISIGVDS